MNNFFATENYWININKPLNYSSAKIVAIVKKITQSKKVGHAGTLDPLATGVLPIAVNKATKTSDFIMNNDKEYLFTMNWGEFRDTDDLEGKIIKTSTKRPKTSEILKILPYFIGKIEQIPPKFSAIKINGQKAYNMARKNQDFTIKPRIITIKQINLLENNKKYAKFLVKCSKGTYVRALCRDIALKTGSCAYISVLKRTKTGIFNINNTISLDNLKKLVKINNINGSIFKLRDVLGFMPEITLNNELSFKVKNGQVIPIDNISIFNWSDINQNSLIKIINNDELIGLGKINQNKLKPINIFNNL